jgi:uncharacterized protein YjeT (DUF2065 family)
MRSTLVRIVAAGDVLGGLALAGAASWFGDQLDLATSTVRIAGLVTLVLGVDLLWLQAKPFATRVAMVTEALFALLAVDVLVLRDPTGVGTGMLVATALYGVAMAVELALLHRSTRALTPA